MPPRSKSRRVAAKQTQLKKKKRQSKGPSGVIEEPLATDQVADAAQPGKTAPSPQPRVASEPRPASPRQTGLSSKQTEIRSNVYSYVAPEIRRIGIPFSGILAILIALTFALR